ncbi:hypothetical protein DFR59_105148 [Falsibacillus pallidus]|uniref:Uncharacterized protein n=1 Tax=Falsibacillus pallidus TaxID=493781 RepID=A0A370GF52_9BACI|nr:hypothetical protein DFR59_105148 [Falsibacillus pallidus]
MSEDSPAPPLKYLFLFTDVQVRYNRIGRKTQKNCSIHAETIEQIIEKVQMTNEYFNR